MQHGIYCKYFPTLITIIRCSKRQDEDLEPLVKLCSSMTLRCRDTALVGEMFWSHWDVESLPVSLLQCSHVCAMYIHKHILIIIYTH